MENEALASECVRCGTPLQNYAQLLNYPASLFNLGLAKTRTGELGQARDLFAAVVYWCPKDVEARNALAMACLALHDLPEARRQWELVLTQAPTNTLALRGLSQLDTTTQRAQVPAQTPMGTDTAHTLPGSSTRKKLLTPFRKKQQRR